MMVRIYADEDYEQFEAEARASGFYVLAGEGDDPIQRTIGRHISVDSEEFELLLLRAKQGLQAFVQIDEETDEE